MADRETWGSRFGFVLAIAGSAIGLGNIWKFPYITGVNGGGAFVLIYLFCILLCGFPILLCELALGRTTGKNPMDAFAMLEGKKRSRLAIVIAILLFLSALTLMFAERWGFGILTLIISALFLKFGFAVAGAISIFAAILILSYYSVIGGWLLEYVVDAVSGRLTVSGTEEADAIFGSFISESGRVVLWHFIFLGLSALMLIGGIRKGIERWSKVLMPMLFVLLLLLIVRSLSLPGAMKGLQFFLQPDFSKITARGVLEALGHSFYTLSLGMGITITYASYLKKGDNLLTSSFLVILTDTCAALLAGIAIFPAVFAMGFSPAAGPSLIFKDLPAVFSKMPLGSFWAAIFFIMITIAALTSAASLLETGVTFLIDKFKFKRIPTVIGLYVFVGFLGVFSCVSIGDWSKIPAVGDFLSTVFGADCIPGNWFDMLDILTSNWMLPLASLFTALFVGWVWTSFRAGRELRYGARHLSDTNIFYLLSGICRGDVRYRKNEDTCFSILVIWGFLIRIVVPAIVLTIFLRAVGVLFK